MTEMNIIWLAREINKYIAPYRWMALFIVCCHILEGGFESAVGMTFKFIIDQAIIPKDYELLILILLMLGSGAILLTVISLLIDYLYAQFSVRLLNKIRQSLFEHIQNLSMEFFGRRSAGDIVKCFLTDAEKVENGVAYGIPGIFYNSSNIFFSGIFLFYLNWQLAIISCIGLVACASAPASSAAALARSTAIWRCFL